MYIFTTLEFPTLIIHRYYHLINYIYWTRAQVVGNGFCSSVVEHWSSNPEDAGLKGYSSPKTSVA